MANGSFSNGSGANCKLVINWSSSKGNSGSTVSATLVAQNQNNWYFNAYVYGGYGITINGSQVTDKNKALSGSINGSVSLISHSVWVSYTGDKTINISGYANFNGIPSLANQTISGNVKLDNVGYVPTMGDVTAPVTSVISETSTSIKITWNKATSYNGSCTYGVGCSINGGDYDWKYPKDCDINTTSYIWELSSPSQGATYKFAVAAKNNIGWSEYKYSGVVTINQISPPTIGDIAVYNPYVNSELAINLTNGSQTNNEDFMRLCDLYFGDTKIASCKGYDNTSWNNTTQSISYAAADYATKIGTKAYSSDNFKIVAWCENANHTKSTTTSKTFTVNINTDGKAVPSMGACTLSGGAFSYPSTCFISGVSNLNVTAATATANRAPSGTTISYAISVTGVPSQNSKSANFGSLTAGHKVITVTATDSRGLSTTVSKDIQFQAYSLPTISKYSAMRLDNPQTSVQLTYTLAYSPIYAYDKDIHTQGTQLNNINVQQYSTDNTHWNTARDGCIITGLSTETIYTIYLRVTDKVKTAEYKTGTYKVPTIRTNVAIRKWGIGLNCVPQSSYALEVRGNTRITDDLTVKKSMSIDGGFVCSGTLTSNGEFKATNNATFSKDITVSGALNGNSNSTIQGSLTVNGDVLVPKLLSKIYPVGAVYITYNNVNPSTFLGGTWERFGQGRTLVGEGTGNDGSTSMSFTSSSTGGEYQHYHAVQVGYTIMYGDVTNGDESKAIMVAKLADNSGWAEAVKDAGYGDTTKFNTGTEYSFKYGNTAQARSSTGTSSKSSGIQPYITVYFWRRTA